MQNVIVVTSGKGGVGKTTTVANLGAGLAHQGKKVILIDTDIGLRNLDVVLGLENRIVYDLVDVVEGTCRLKQALIRDKRYEGLYLLPAAQTRDKMAVTPQADGQKLIGETRGRGRLHRADRLPGGHRTGLQKRHRRREIGHRRDGARGIGRARRRPHHRAFIRRTASTTCGCS